MKDPINYITRAAYAGGNQLILSEVATEKGYKQNVWLTFLQAKSAGLSVKQGEKGVKITRYGKIAEIDEETGKKSFFRHYTVFNIEQCQVVLDDVPIPPVAEPTPAQPTKPLNVVVIAEVSHSSIYDETVKMSKYF